MSEWQECKLGDFINIKHGYAFNGSGITIEETDFILVTPGNFHIGGGFKSTKYKYFSGECPKDYILDDDCIVVTMTDLSKEGDTLGYAAKIPKSKTKKYLHNQRIGLVQFLSDDIDKNFLYWLLRTRDYQGFIIGAATGTSVKHTSPSTIKEYVFALPNLPKQKAIANILSSLDDKIDLLHRQNKTLEAMAETLFRQWFIEEASEDWEIKPLGELVTVKRGGSPRPIQDYLSETGLRWLKISDATKTESPFIFEIKEHIKEEGLNKTTLLKAGTLVLSNSATPGIPKILQVDSCIHDGWLHFPKSHFSNEFLYLLFKSIRLELLNLGNGSIFTNLKTDILKEYPIPIPDDDSLRCFDIQVKQLFGKLLKNTIQIKTLEKLRDNLLPKLMSGEVRVRY